MCFFVFILYLYIYLLYLSLLFFFFSESYGLGSCIQIRIFRLVFLPFRKEILRSAYKSNFMYFSVLILYLYIYLLLLLLLILLLFFFFSKSYGLGSCFQIRIFRLVFLPFRKEIIRFAYKYKIFSCYKR